MKLNLRQPAHPERSQAKSMFQRAAIEAFWLPGSPAKLVEFYRLIALDARDLVRVARLERNERLTPLDAIHLASAQRLGAADFHTYDARLLRFDGTLSFPIREPWTAVPRLPGVR